MRKFLLSGLAFGALALPAMAADMAPAPLPVYKAPVPVEICNWCGWYIGANAGYAWSNSDSVDTATTNLSAIPALNGNVGGAIATRPYYYPYYGPYPYPYYGPRCRAWNGYAWVPTC